MPLKNTTSMFSETTLRRLYLSLLICLPLSLMAQERVFVHTDRNVYLSGETIWFQAYCLDGKTNTPSPLSKVLYLELLDEKGQPVQQLKVWLEDGMGDGNLFVDGDIATGMYYLKAYTAWMRNFPSAFFFEKPIRIIHPLQPAAAGLRSQPAQAPDTLEVSPSNLSIKLTEDRFAPRSAVQVQLPDLPEAANLSIAVYRDAPELVPSAPSMQQVMEEAPDPLDLSTYDQLQHPPEFHSQLLRGKINGASEAPVFALFPGRNAMIYPVQTNEKGEFALELAPSARGDQIFFWRKDKALPNEQVQLYPTYVEDQDIRQPAPWTVDSSWLPFLEQLSVGSQLSNAYLTYSQVRGQAAAADTAHIPFFGAADTEYLLDAYTRFPTMDEVFLEYIQFINKRKLDGKQVVYINDLYANEVSVSNSLVFDQPGLVMIDGIPIHQLDQLWELDPLLVHSIQLVKRRYLIGDQLFYGILYVRTYKHNLGGEVYPGYLASKPFMGIQQPASFRPHLQDAEARIPDYRNLLYWNPALQLPAGSADNAFSFFTSDQKGSFRIEINGLGADGTLFYGTTLFTVK